MSPNSLTHSLWQREWRESFRTVGELLVYLELEQSIAPYPIDQNPHFPLRIPRYFADLMHKGDWEDPLLRQVLSQQDENRNQPGYVADAVGDTAAKQGQGLLRKYSGRALLVLTGECAIHCRYCFRREYPYSDLPVAREVWEKTYAQLHADSSLEEIIFSGGDPLALSNNRLRWHWEQALAIPQLQRVRIHTRVPVVLPSRMDREFLALVSELSAKRPLFLVMHLNHARECSTAFMEKAKALKAAGAVLLNQTVLLKQVNDDAESLVALSLRLLEAGIIPYYLHQLDRVRGTQHFEVDETRGRALMQEIRSRLPGYAIPRYVREISGATSKTEII